jgi:hypothetical protein
MLGAKAPGMLQTLCSRRSALKSRSWSLERGLTGTRERGDRQRRPEGGWLPRWGTRSLLESRTPAALRMT